MVQNLQDILRSGSPITQIDYLSLLHITHRSKLDSISALSQQYQRFCTAAHMAMAQPAPPYRPLQLTTRQSGSVISTFSIATSCIATPNWCRGAIDFQINENLRLHTQAFKCPGCQAEWTSSVDRPNLPQWANAFRGMRNVFQYKTACAIGRPAEVSVHGLLGGVRRRVGVYERGRVDGAYEPTSYIWWVSVVQGQVWNSAEEAGVPETWM
jgi:hypothetical protein